MKTLEQNDTHCDYCAKVIKNVGRKHVFQVLVVSVKKNIKTRRCYIFLWKSKSNRVIKTEQKKEKQVDPSEPNLHRVMNIKKSQKLI